jgi:hypothetical protein
VDEIKRAMTQSETSELTANGSNRRRASQRASAPDDLNGATGGPLSRLRTGASAAAEVLPEAVGRIRGAADTVADRLPGAVESARATALETANSIRGLPEPTRRSVATLSIGLGIGLALAGAPRLLTMVALAPALVAAMAATGQEALAGRATIPG